MPSRRKVVRGVGPVFVGAVAGCLSSRTTTGTVAHKRLGVSVQQTVGDPVDTSLAVLTYESRGTVTGEYADIVSEAVEGASISVPDAVHERLAERFVDVHYYSNIVPDDGSEPTDGRLSREAFNTLTVGGTATVDASMKTVGQDSSISHLEIHDTTSRQAPPAETSISQYDWDERAGE